MGLGAAFIIGDVQQPDPFERLDDFINGDRDAVQSFYRDLRPALSGPSDSGNYGPFTDDDEMRTHWSEDWTDRDGHGGVYWPYLTSVSIHTLLTQGLIDSIGIALNTGKRHRTVWVPVLDPPEDAAANLSPDEQARLFRVEVHEAPNTALLLIITPGSRPPPS